MVCWIVRPSKNITRRSSERYLNTGAQGTFSITLSVPHGEVDRAKANGFASGIHRISPRRPIRCRDTFGSVRHYHAGFSPQAGLMAGEDISGRISLHARFFFLHRLIRECHARRVVRDTDMPSRSSTTIPPCPLSRCFRKFIASNAAHSRASCPQGHDPQSTWLAPAS